MLLGLFMLLLFMLVPPMFVFAGVIAGVGVLVGVEAVFAVFVVLVVFVVFVLSLPQPIPKAARASRVRRAKVLRIEFFSCNPKGQIVRELKRKRRSSVSAGTHPTSTQVNCLSARRLFSTTLGVAESRRIEQVNYSEVVNVHRLYISMRRAKFQEVLYDIL